MILKNLENINKNFFSVIIIGSGPAGISTALSLEKNNIRCLLLESGNLDEFPESDKFLNGDVLGDNYANLSSVRIRKFGGTSELWGGYCNKFERDEFINWPIDYDELHKFDNECKKILNLKFYHSDFFNSKFSENFNQFNIRFSPVKFKDYYYEKIKNSKLIYLSLNTTFLNFVGSNNEINFAQCINNKKKYNLSSQYFVLAAGGIENSRLMLWSKEKNNELFGKLPLGKYYMDHPWHQPAEGFLNYKRLIDYFEKYKIRRELYVNCLPRIYLSTSKNIVKKKKVLRSGIYLRIENKDHINKDFLEKALCVAPNYIKNKFDNVKTQFFKFNVNLHQEQEPKETNNISLSKKYDPNGVPLVNLNWKMSDKLKKSAAINLMLLGDFLINHNIGRISIDEYVINGGNYDVMNGAHQMGGTCAGTDIKNSVVNKDLKVHNINNLFICGSSIFPTSGYCHPTYTIVLLSLRLGNHIKKKL